MIAFIQTSIVGILTWMCAGDSEMMMRIGFILICIGNIGSLATYEHLK